MIRWNVIYGVKTGIWTLGVEPAGIHVSGNWFGPEVATHLSAH